MKKVALAVTLLLLARSPSAGQSQGASLDSLRFLVGKWVGEGGGDAGAGSGYFTFEEGLSGKVLIRKNHAEYPATKDRPSFTHDDLMIVYTDPASKQLRAFYTDTEGHVINYTTSVSGDGRRVVFLSDTRPASPTYRLTYVRSEADSIALTFEAAPPGRPGEFSKLLEGRVRKLTGVR